MCENVHTHHFKCANPDLPHVHSVKRTLAIPNSGMVKTSHLHTRSKWVSTPKKCVLPWYHTPLTLECETHVHPPLFSVKILTSMRNRERTTSLSHHRFTHSERTFHACVSFRTNPLQVATVNPATFEPPLSEHLWCQQGSSSSSTRS